MTNCCLNLLFIKINMNFNYKNNIKFYKSLKLNIIN